MNARTELLAAVTRALNAGPFVDPVIVRGHRVTRSKARHLERFLTRKTGQVAA